MTNPYKSLTNNLLPVNVYLLLQRVFRQRSTKNIDEQSTNCCKSRSTQHCDEDLPVCWTATPINRTIVRKEWNIIRIDVIIMPEIQKLKFGTALQLGGDFSSQLVVE